MAIATNPLLAAGTVGRKVGGKDSLLVTVTHTGDAGRVAVDDVLVVSRAVVFVVNDAAVSGSELVVFKIDDYAFKVT